MPTRAWMRNYVLQQDHPQIRVDVDDSRPARDEELEHCESCGRDETEVELRDYWQRTHMERWCTDCIRADEEGEQ